MLVDDKVFFCFNLYKNILCSLVLGLNKYVLINLGVLKVLVVE